MQGMYSMYECVEYMNVGNVLMFGMHKCGECMNVGNVIKEDVFFPSHEANKLHYTVTNYNTQSHYKLHFSYTI